MTNPVTPAPAPRGIFARLGDLAIDATFIGGAALVSYGAHLAWHPAGPMAAGGFLISAAWMVARGQAAR